MSSLLRTIGKFFTDMSNRLSTAVEEHVDPKEQIKATVRHVKEQGPQINAAFSAVVAHYRELEAKESQIQADLTKLEADMGRARTKNNDEVGKVLAGQYVGKKAELAALQAELKTAAAQAQSARDQREDWMKQVRKLETDASATLEQSEQAEAQEAVNSALAAMKVGDPTSEYAAASHAISDRLAKAKASAELDTDPAEATIRDFDRQSARDEADAVWQSFKAGPPTPAAV